MLDVIHNTRAFELLRFAEVHRRHAEALARATGEHFNLFNILDIGHYEVITHSPILGELLNPKGSHGQGATFLRLFLKQPNINITDFAAESETAKLIPEDYFPPDKDEPGGRLDIAVDDGKGKRLIIENKIHDPGSKNQMKKYRDRYPKAKLFYLTLRGERPKYCNENDVHDIGFECISYREDILKWLEECRKEAVCLPTVRETITQYIHLIQELTEQSTNLMNANLINQILADKEGEGLAAFFALYETRDAVLAELVKRLNTQVIEIGNSLDLQRTQDVPPSDFYFTAPWIEKNNLQIGFAFEKNNYGHFYFGFATFHPEQECPVKEQLRKLFLEQFPRMQNDPDNKYWAAWAWWDAYKNWNHETWGKIHSGQFVKEFRENLEKMVAIARNLP